MAFISETDKKLIPINTAYVEKSLIDDNRGEYFDFMKLYRDMEVKQISYH